MKRFWRIARWVVYPLFYLFCLLLFGYLTFPFEALKHRIIAEFDRSQQRSARRGRGAPMRLEIGELDGYWLTGVEVDNAKLIIPPKKKSRKRGALAALAKSDDSPAKDSVIAIEHATARLQLLPLLLGNVRINFDALALGGEVEGSIPYGDSGDVEVTLEGLQLREVEPLQALLMGIPLSGSVSGSLNLTPKAGKFAKADGRLSLRLADVVLGAPGKNGKLEVQGTKLPSPQIGQITLEAVATNGLLTFEDLSSRGRDAEFFGEGKIKLHESWGRSQADVFLKFRFSDVYRTSDPAVQGLLGKPGDKFPPAIEVAPRSPFPKAKTDDGFYRFHLHGALSKLDTDPAGTNAKPSSRKNRRRGKPNKRANRAGGRNALGGLLAPPKPTPQKKAAGSEKEEEKEREEAGGREPAPDAEAEEEKAAGGR